MALPLSQFPDLAPYRDYDEHDVINGIYSIAPASAPLLKGTFVSILTASGNPNAAVTGSGVAQNGMFIDNLGSWGGAPGYAFSPRFGIKWNLVKAANSGDVPLGVSLYDCKEFNEYGENLAYRPRTDRDRNEVILPGEGLKILTKGKITTNGFTGVPSPGSGAYVHSGILVPCPYFQTFPKVVGKFLEPAVNGFVLFQVEL